MDTLTTDSTEKISLLNPVTVGIMHASTNIGRAYIDAEMVAISEINTAGGIMNGRQILPIVRTCPSGTCKEQARSLVENGNVTVIFGLDNAYDSDALDYMENVQYQSAQTQPVAIWSPASFASVACRSNTIVFGDVSTHIVQPAIDLCMQRNRRAFYILYESDSVGLSAGLKREAERYLLEKGQTLRGTNVTDASSSAFFKSVVQTISSIADGCVILNFMTVANTKSLMFALYDAFVSRSAFPVFHFQISGEAA